MRSILEDNSFVLLSLFCLLNEVKIRILYYQLAKKMINNFLHPFHGFDYSLHCQPIAIRIVYFLHGFIIGLILQ